MPTSPYISKIGNRQRNPTSESSLWQDWRRMAAHDSEANRDAALIGRLVARADSGDASAKDALFTALYEELHRLAQAHLRRSDPNLMLGTTSLLHEAYLDMARRSGLDFPDRSRFLRYASRAMRGLVIDYVRQRAAHKRGGELTFTTLSGHEEAASEQPVDLERLGAALTELAAVDEALAELVDLKFFCGFSFGEIAAFRGVSERTVQRDWAKARLLLHQELADVERGPERS